jgi:RNA polymerase sigma-70 factor (ECF subfamily)
MDPEHWLDRYGDYLFRFALARIGDPSAAEDVVQETLLAALKARHDFQNRSDFRTWLTGILKHKIVDHFRRQRPDRIGNGLDPAELPSESPFDGRGRWKNPPRTWGSDPLGRVERKEFLSWLFRCLGELPERMARVFSLREFEGVDTALICQELDISPTNCWTLLHRARMKLRRCLETFGVDRGD